VGTKTRPGRQPGARRPVGLGWLLLGVWLALAGAAARAQPQSRLTETPDDPRGVIVEAAGDGLTDDSVANGQVFVYNPNGSAAGRIDVPERPLHERARCTIRTVGR
jgi:hypothetical protein